MLTLVNILITLLLLCVVLGIAYKIAELCIGLLPDPMKPTAAVILKVVLLLVLLVFVVSFIGHSAGWITSGPGPLRIWK